MCRKDISKQTEHHVSGQLILLYPWQFRTGVKYNVSGLENTGKVKGTATVTTNLILCMEIIYWDPQLPSFPRTLVDRILTSKEKIKALYLEKVMSPREKYLKILYIRVSQQTTYLTTFPERRLNSKSQPICSQLWISF